MTTQAGFAQPSLTEWNSLRGSATRSIQTARASEALSKLLDVYSGTPHAVDVSFRELVGPIPVNDLSHSTAPYPGRLLRQIPRFFLHCEQLVRPGSVVLDPFCGSGTVLVEARAARVTGWGIDCNPFARLLTRVKTRHLDVHTGRRAIAAVLHRAKLIRTGDIPDVVNIDLWFSQPVKHALARIRRALTELKLPTEVNEYLLVCLGVTADRCSLRDHRIPVPVRRRDWHVTSSRQQHSLVWHTFLSVGNALAERLSTVDANVSIRSVVEGEDARRAADIYSTRLADRLERPSLILTSPPYGAAQKYIRSSSLALGWTGLARATDLASLERELIGREHLQSRELSNFEVPDESIADEIAKIRSRDSVRAAIYAEYFRSMDEVLLTLSKLLAPGGTLVLVAGDNTAGNRCIQTHSHLRDLAVRHGLISSLELRDTIRGRVLLTKRASTSRPLVFETVHVLRKAPV
jgi:hypothetical protein